MSYSFSARATRPEDVMFEMVGEEAVVLKLETQLFMGLDAVGARMWNLVTSANSIQQAYDQMLDEYEVEANQLRRDLQEFLVELERKGLIEILPASQTVP
jgi:hypothetical protein